MDDSCNKSSFCSIGLCDVQYNHNQVFCRSEKGATIFFYFMCGIYAKTYMGRNSVLHNEWHSDYCVWGSEIILGVLGLWTCIHQSNSFMQSEAESSDRAEQLVLQQSCVLTLQSLAFLHNTGSCSFFFFCGCVPYNENTTLLSYILLWFTEKAKYIINFDSFNLSEIIQFSLGFWNESWITIQDGLFVESLNHKKFTAFIGFFQIIVFLPLSTAM